jgi:hypothetical protein
MKNNNKLVMVIDSKPYKVNIHFNHTATENINDKIFRLIRNEVEAAAVNANIITDTKAVTSSCIQQMPLTV